jgi:methylthioribulose-1-phosphate dehydratase
MSAAPPAPDRDRFAATLIAAVTRLHGRGLMPGTGGNGSVALAHAPLRALVTASGVDKGRLTAQQLLVVDGAGGVLDGEGRPSAETAVHLELLGRGADAVLHVHSVWNTLASLRGADAGAIIITGLEMLKGLDGVTTHAHRAIVPVIANDQDLPALAATLGRALDAEPSAHGVLVAGHGLYTWGRDLATTERHVEVFEFLFEVIERRAR